jgi:hypothetical protein
VIFLILWQLRGHGHAPVWLFKVYCALPALERLLLERLRVVPDCLSVGRSIAQVVALVIPVPGAVLFCARRDGAYRPKKDTHNGLFALPTAERRQLLVRHFASLVALLIGWDRERNWNPLVGAVKQSDYPSDNKSKAAAGESLKNSITALLAWPRRR